jgi:hypothetical protein
MCFDSSLAPTCFVTRTVPIIIGIINNVVYIYTYTRDSDDVICAGEMCWKDVIQLQHVCVCVCDAKENCTQVCLHTKNTQKRFMKI